MSSMTSMSTHCTIADADAREVFLYIIRSNGITDTVTNVLINDACLNGEGFASLTKYVTIKFENLDINPLSLFVKMHPSNASLSEMNVELKEFEKESMFLVRYVTAAKEMCREKGFEGFIDFYPKCYYGNEVMIVLENLAIGKGYQLIDKIARQDFEAATFAIKTLAKHHAISHVMIQEAGGAEKFFERFPNLDLEAYDKPALVNMMNAFYISSFHSSMKILEKSSVEGAAEVADKLVKHMDKVGEKVLNAITGHGNDNGLLVLGHGDYWNNNMMFLKDQATNKIIHHVVIDFAVARYNSPVLDLGYYLFSSVQPEVRKKHLKDLLELYLETLNNVSNDFGHPINLSYEQLFDDFRKRLDCGFWTGFTVAIRPAMDVLEQIDINEVDVKDYAGILDDLTNKWVQENPEKLDEIAKELSQVLGEYEELLLPQNTADKVETET